MPTTAEDVEAGVVLGRTCSFGVGVDFSSSKATTAGAERAEGPNTSKATNMSVRVPIASHIIVFFIYVCLRGLDGKVCGKS
jgi:hypothetical protein